MKWNNSSESRSTTFDVGTLYSNAVRTLDFLRFSSVKTKVPEIYETSPYCFEPSTIESDHRILQKSAFWEIQNLARDYHVIGRICPGFSIFGVLPFSIIE